MGPSSPPRGGTSWTKATAPAPPPPPTPRPPSAEARGILRPEIGRRYFTVDRVAPPEDLAWCLEHLWSVQWSLPPGTTYRSEVLTHPSVHLTVEWGAGPRHGVAMPAALVHGVVSRAFAADLWGRGAVCGARFRTGAFGVFVADDVARLTDRVVALGDVLGPEAGGLTEAVLGAAGEAERWGELCRFLRRRAARPDERYEVLRAVVDVMAADRALTTVGAVTAACGIPARKLQRLFRRYVGVGPKWVLQRFRLHDAVASIDSGEYTDLASLAAELGWYDQAHFNRDFTDAVGVSSGRYARREGPAGGPSAPG